MNAIDLSDVLRESIGAWFPLVVFGAIVLIRFIDRLVAVRMQERRRYSLLIGVEMCSASIVLLVAGLAFLITLDGVEAALWSTQWALQMLLIVPLRFMAGAGRIRVDYLQRQFEREDVLTLNRFSRAVMFLVNILVLSAAAISLTSVSIWWLKQVERLAIK